MSANLTDAQINALINEPLVEVTLVSCVICERDVPTVDGGLTCCGRRYEIRGGRALILRNGRLLCEGEEWTTVRRPSLTQAEIEALPQPLAPRPRVRAPWDD